ncbi:MAG TPA: alcohol dehydrogenase catalytic domain-containing protein [Actinomycetes bacterium]
MRAYLLTGPREGGVQDVAAPLPGPGDAIVDVHRVGLCGTDVEFFTGEMAYLHEGHAAYPLRLGHEWCGTVSAVGDPADESWLGRRVTGDTMIGCGHCDRCRSGRHNVCANRWEIGIRGGFPGALAEQLRVPVSALLALPDAVDDTAAAMVEPGGNALRSVRAAELRRGDRLLVLGTGTIGLLVAELARAAGAEVHLMGEGRRGIEFAASLGFSGVWEAPALPGLALDLVEPGKRVVYIGLSGTPSLVDTRTMALKDVTAVGILAASQGLAEAIEHYAAGDVDPRPLVAATVGLDQVSDVLSGARPVGSGDGPKIHIDPRA